MKTHLALTLVLAIASGCTDDDEPSAPEISNLTATPGTVLAGMRVMVTGTVDFVDPDGDVDQVKIAATLPNGTVMPFTPSPIQNVATQTEGTVSWVFIVTPPTAGRYELALSLLDEAMNESNALTTVITAN